MRCILYNKSVTEIFAGAKKLSASAKIMLDISARIVYNNPCSLYGRLAQLVEHPLDVRAVEGSSPPASTTYAKSRLNSGFLFYLT